MGLRPGWLRPKIKWCLIVTHCKTRVYKMPGIEINICAIKLCQIEMVNLHAVQPAVRDCQSAILTVCRNWRLGWWPKVTSFHKVRNKRSYMENSKCIAITDKCKEMAIKCLYLFSLYVLLAVCGVSTNITAIAHYHTPWPVHCRSFECGGAGPR